jgi:GalNAc-alpha-(1->4)-GalNAc-alpha-(1->3)-diNAcBac-PP-undecaprenol alpha-1,4-N-acetyl-D-galactosaminyltransferase
VSKVGIVVGSLRMGGAERTAVSLATHLVGAGLDVTVVTIADEGPDHFALPSGARRARVILPPAEGWKLRRLGNALRRILALRRTLRGLGPDAVVALGAVPSVVSLVASLGIRVPVVVSERTNPRLARDSRMVSLARRLTYPLSRFVVVQTEALRSWAEDVAPADRVRVIPNAARLPEPRSRVAHRRPAVVAVGRLIRDKGFDLLVRAFATTRQAHPEGPERTSLESLIRDLRLGSDVLLPGATDDPDAAMRAADIFVLSSRREGFPNVLLEALANGCACVAFDCECGPRELLRDGVDGLLVPGGNEPALAGALSRLMGDEALRRALAARAPECMERFSPDRIGAMWLELLPPS